MLKLRFVPFQRILHELHQMNVCLIFFLVYCLVYDLLLEFLLRLNATTISLMLLSNFTNWALTGLLQIMVQLKNMVGKQICL